MVDRSTVEFGRRYNRISFHLQDGEISYTLNLCDYLRQCDVCIATQPRIVQMCLAQAS